MKEARTAGISALRVVTRLSASRPGRSTGDSSSVASPSSLEFTARLVAAGRIRALGGRPGRYVVRAEAIRTAIDAGLFRGLACFVDHAEGHPSVRDLLGVWHGVGWDEASQSAVGQLRVFETAANRPIIDLLQHGLVADDQMAAADDQVAADDRPDLGISIVFYPRLGPDGETIEGLRMIESADVVMFPAVESGRLLARGAAQLVEGRGVGPARAGSPRYMDSYSQTSVTQEEKTEMAQREQLTANGVDGDGATAVADRTMETVGGVGKALDWQSALQATTTEAIIAASGLPGVVQDRLRGVRYDSPEQVQRAVGQARTELAALSEASVIRLGNRPPREIQLSDPLDRARELVGFFFGDTEAGAPPPALRSFADLYVALTGDVYFRGVFDPTRVAFAGATTSTLPNLAVDAMNKVIVQQFQALDHYRWYERITSVEPNDGTLHAMKWITLGGVGNLPSVNEGAAYTELDVADVKESAAFVKRGGYVGITREMIKNSNIQQLQAIPRALAVAAVRTRSSAVAALFTTGSGVGPTLAQDSKALFHADHDNLTTTAFGTDAAAWRAARAECFQQAEVGSGKALGIFPRYVLVPAALYDTALSVLGYGEGMPTTYAPEAQGRGFADPRPVPLVVPDWTDGNDWAYVVDPAVFPVIQMSYSQQPGGRRHPAPELFTVVSDTSGLLFSNDILPVKVRDEFALGVNGHRGIGKRNVA